MNKINWHYKIQINNNNKIIKTNKINNNRKLLNQNNNYKHLKKNYKI